MDKSFHLANYLSQIKHYHPKRSKLAHPNEGYVEISYRNGVDVQNRIIIIIIIIIIIRCSFR